MLEINDEAGDEWVFHLDLAARVYINDEPRDRFGAADGRAAQVTLWADRLHAPACRVEVVAARGRAVAEGARTLRWRTSDGAMRQTLPRHTADIGPSR